MDIPAAHISWVKPAGRAGERHTMDNLMLQRQRLASMTNSCHLRQDSRDIVPVCRGRSEAPNAEF